MRKINVGGVWRRDDADTRQRYRAPARCLLVARPPRVGAGLPPTPVVRDLLQVDVPRQLTIEAAEQLLVQYNLAVIAARYGVDQARAQRLIAAVRPNPTLTLGAEQFDLAAPGRTCFPAIRRPTAPIPRLDRCLNAGNKRALRTAAAEFQIQAARRRSSTPSARRCSSSGRRFIRRCWPATMSGWRARIWRSPRRRSV